MQTRTRFQQKVNPSRRNFAEAKDSSFLTLASGRIKLLVEQPNTMLSVSNTQEAMAKRSKPHSPSAL